ncbi:hypothetical protein [Pseudonocardia broussonetiae]|uniref:Uncharacterized protein n=1 Tax=Pseudonocardia broussonetiae TaxID=2736640 RepID=A0A6M6JPR6_9PSEU|nr:hypothetical protein [Pseudonocardia broussonetiae]QJY48957.1 hypothetical protein HOP40_26865 [Pseudonocardia broussonetiae]
MLDPHLLTLHTLTMKQLATAEELAGVSGQPATEVEAELEKAVADGAVMAARGKFMITPAGREQLDAAYPVVFGALRSDPAVAAAMDAFESGVNKQVLKVTTDWQTVEVGGERVTNDHSDADHDAKVLDRLGRILDKLPAVLGPVEDPLVGRFVERLGTALTRAEGGETDYVSGVRVDSFHTVWFQMHEHLLRLTGREREE